MKPSMDSRLSLIKKWGPEVVLQCKCSYHKAHSMMGYPAAKCPKCKTICESTDLTWDQLDNQNI